MKVNKYQKAILIILILSTLFTFSLSNISAVDTSQSPTQVSLGTFKQGDVVQIFQTCNNGTAPCDACNISYIQYPASPTYAVENVPMTKSSTNFNYTLLGNYTQILGTYTASGLCSSAGEIANFNFNFLISKSGSNFSTSQALVYGIVFVVLLFMFIIFLYGSFHFKFKNKVADDGVIEWIDYKKYIKVFCMLGAYLVFTFLMGVSYGITNNFLELEIGSNFFFYLYGILLGFIFPLFFFGFFFLAYTYMTDEKLKKMIKRGLRPKI